MFQSHFRPTHLPLTSSMFNGPDLTRVPARPATLLRVASFSAPESGHGEATAAAEAAARRRRRRRQSPPDMHWTEKRRRYSDSWETGSSEPEILTAGAKEFNSAQPALQAAALLDDGEPGGVGNCCWSSSSSSSLLAWIMTIVKKTGEGADAPWRHVAALRISPLLPSPPNDAQNS